LINCIIFFIYRDFVNVCNDGLDLNAKLITTEQKEYHESLKTGFNDIVSRLSKIFGETVRKCDVIVCACFVIYVGIYKSL
jgi:hypothetical protein